MIGAAENRQEQEVEQVVKEVVEQISPSLPKGIMGGHKSTRLNKSYPELEPSTQRLGGRGQPQADQIPEPMESAFDGVDFSKLRVHHNTESEGRNRRIQAQAFTTGQNIFSRQGAYQPGTRGGQELSGHELKHVVDQNQQIAQSGSSKKAIAVKNTNMMCVQRKTEGFLNKIVELDDVINKAEEFKNAPKEQQQTEQITAFYSFMNIVLDDLQTSQFVDNLKKYKEEIPEDDFAQQKSQLEEIQLNLGKFTENQIVKNQKLQKLWEKLPVGGEERNFIRKIHKVIDNLIQAIEEEHHTVSTPSDQKHYQDAIKQHEQDRNLLKEYVNEGLKSDDRTLRNSCQWLFPPNQKSKLYALTTTADSNARVIEAGKNPQTKLAVFPNPYFNKGDIYEEPTKYKPHDLSYLGNSLIKDKFEIGFSSRSQEINYVAIINPSYNNKEEVLRMLKHEVQHKADKNGGRENSQGFREIEEREIDSIRQNSKTLEQIRKRHQNYEDEKEYFRSNYPSLEAEYQLSRYKTEYRAYWYGNRKKAQEIQDHIFRSYPYIKQAIDQKLTLADGTEIINAIDMFNVLKDPDVVEKDSFNKYNSPPIDDFYEALDKIGEKAEEIITEQIYDIDARPVTRKESNQTLEVEELMNTIHRLELIEVESILLAEGAMMKKIDNHLEGEARTKVLESLKEQKNKAPLDVQIITRTDQLNSQIWELEQVKNIRYDNKGYINSFMDKVLNILNSSQVMESLQEYKQNFPYQNFEQQKLQLTKLSQNITKYTSNLSPGKSSLPQSARNLPPQSARNLPPQSAWNLPPQSARNLPPKPVQLYKRIHQKIIEIQYLIKTFENHPSSPTPQVSK